MAATKKTLEAYQPTTAAGRPIGMWDVIIREHATANHPGHVSGMGFSFFHKSDAIAKRDELAPILGIEVA